MRILAAVQNYFCKIRDAT